ncbi:hypothetical protein [Paraburkholderia azotifigens]|uniref:O-antigen ligase family protein n=1 Tax=Paraburkholderia azotifigens TaxID=2057004 RepID=A0A5C6VM37_9BURK|nr:hypothetical protein [Paraburkholderia azotifigens]TXC86483.1 hypothetical protein FRZ40_02170 [Paraburkholderia azotifigens]
MPSIYGIVVILIGLLVLYTSFRGAIYAMAVFSLFACTLALGLGSIGIMPAQLFLIFFALRAFNLSGGRGITDAFAMDKAGFWLLCTTLWGVAGAVILPRLLQGSTLVFPVDRGITGVAMLQPLGPVSGNLSQAIYCVGDLAVYACMVAFLKYRGAYRALASGIFLLTCLDVSAGVIDFVTHAAGLDVMSVIKTASYADLSGEELGGLVRITGTFAETSAFSSFTLPLFVFCLNLWLLGYRPKMAGLLAIATGTLLLMSTSGTAYVGLAAYMGVQVFSRPGRVSPGALERQQRMWIIAACAGVLGTLYVLLFMPGVAKALTDFVDTTVMSKADSSSGIERMSWNTQGVTNFLDTYGIGVGLGSIRASSFVVVVLANLGAVGVICYGMFLARTLLSPVSTHYPPTERAVCHAARHGMIATLIVASLAAGVFELGSTFYLFAAAAGALSQRAPRRVPRRPGWVTQHVQERIPGPR